MKNKRSLILLLLACCLAQTAFGQITFGEPNCGQWISRKRESDKAWLLGYLSGLNAWNAAAMWKSERGRDDPFKQIRAAEQLFLWTDNFCRANPLDSLKAAGDSLFIELLVKRPPAQ